MIHLKSLDVHVVLQFSDFVSVKFVILAKLSWKRYSFCTRETSTPQSSINLITETQNTTQITIKKQVVQCIREDVYTNSTTRKSTRGAEEHQSWNKLATGVTRDHTLMSHRRPRTLLYAKLIMEKIYFTDHGKNSSFSCTYSGKLFNK